MVDANSCYTPAKAIEVGASAIGMSGLLVKSTLVMRDNLEELTRRRLSHIPVILGGAALTIDGQSSGVALFAESAAGQAAILTGSDSLPAVEVVQESSGLALDVDKNGPGDSMRVRSVTGTAVRAETTGIPRSTSSPKGN